MPRITPKDAEGLLAAYAKVHAPKDESTAETNTEAPPEPESSENNK